MCHALNQHIPFDAIARWWYILVAGPLLGLTFSLITGFEPLQQLPKTLSIVEGPPTNIQVSRLVLEQSGQEDLLFTVLGFLLACGVIWLLEEIGAYHNTSASFNLP